MADRALFGVAGRPVLHSLSPVLFRAAYGGRAGAQYTRVSAGTAGEVLRFARDLGLAGLNVTAPHKEGVLALLGGAVDGTAAEVGAVNTLVRDGAGFRGANTDPAGVSGALAAAGVDVRGRRGLVLGAGGAGRAAAHALRSGGATVVLAGRTEARASAAAAKLGVGAVRWEDRESALAGCDLLVSALPRDAEPVRADRLRPDLVVLEAAYPETPLAHRARALGARVVRGEDWLLHQAVPAFRLLTGAEPDVPAMAAALRPSRTRRAPDPLKVALVGFMGSGKTTVGRRLAGELGLPFADSDERVERGAGRSVPEIFAAEGEPSFRGREARVLRDILSGRAGVVCACGGGSVESAANRDLLSGSAIVVWLHAAPSVCRARIDAATRPLLAARDGTEAALDGLFRARVSCYAEVADLVVGAEAPVEETVRTIHEEIRRLVAD